MSPSSSSRRRLRLAERRPAVALVELPAAELRQPRIGGVALGDVRRGQPVAQVLGQVEGAALGDAEGVGHGLGPLGEALGLLGRAPQVELAVGPALGVAAVERGAVADGAERVVEPVPLRVVVVDVSGGDDPHAQLAGQRHLRPDAGLVALDQVVVQLDPHVSRPEPVDPAAQHVPRPRSIAGGHPLGQLPTAPAGEADDPGGVLPHVMEGGAGIAPAPFPVGLLGQAPAVGQADQPAQVGVSLAGLGQQREVVAGAGGDVVGVGVGIGVGCDGELDADDGADAGVPARPGEHHGAVEVVAVGDRQGCRSRTGRPGRSAPWGWRRPPAASSRCGGAARRRGHPRGRS